MQLHALHLQTSSEGRVGVVGSEKAAAKKTARPKRHEFNAATSASAAASAATDDAWT
jgi:hypothetical protein